MQYSNKAVADDWRRCAKTGKDSVFGWEGDVFLGFPKTLLYSRNGESVSKKAKIVSLFSWRSDCYCFLAPKKGP